MDDGRTDNGKVLLAAVWQYLLAICPILAKSTNPGIDRQLACQPLHGVHACIHEKLIHYNMQRFIHFHLFQFEATVYNWVQVRTGALGRFKLNLKGILTFLSLSRTEAGMHSKV